MAKAIQESRLVIEGLLGEGEIKIYELIQEVGQSDVFSWSEDPFLALYQKQFITQAALCELYFDYASAGQKYVSISPISVAIVEYTAPTREQSAGLPVDEYVPNFEFYLTADNFYSATPETVQSLLDAFWTRFSAQMQQLPALEVLGLQEGASWQAIQKRFRELAAKNHPDKGGDKHAFIQIRHAFECLKKVYLS